MRFRLPGFWFLAIFGILLIGQGHAISDCPENPINNFDPTTVSSFVSCFNQNMFDGDIWVEYFLPILIYIIFPLVLVFFILYTVLEEIKLFKPKIRIALALLLALISYPAGIVTGLVAFLAGVGATISVLFVFALFFGLGLSHYYRKQAEEKFDFVMGSRILTIYLVHLPVLAIFLLGGFLLGSIASFERSGYLFSQLLLPPFLDLPWIFVGLAVVAIFMLIRKYRNEFWVVGLVAFITLSLLIAPLFIADNLLRSQLVGAGIGLLITHFYVLLEKGRRGSINTIIDEGIGRIQDSLSQIAMMEQILEILTDFKNKLASGDMGNSTIPKDVNVGGHSVFKKGDHITIHTIDQKISHVKAMKEAFEFKKEQEESHHNKAFYQNLYKKRD